MGGASGSSVNGNGQAKGKEFEFQTQVGMRQSQGGDGGGSFGKGAAYNSKDAGKRSVVDLTSLSEETLLKLCKPVDQKLIRALEKKGFEVRIATPGSDTLAYLEYRNVRALTFAGDEKLIFIRENATKSELLEEFLHNTQFKLKMNEKMSLQELEVHVKHFMKNHAEILGINNKYDLEFLERLVKMEKDILKRNKP